MPDSSTSSTVLGAIASTLPSSAIPDPYVPVDGTMNVTGALVVSGDVTSGDDFVLPAYGALENGIGAGYAGVLIGGGEIYLVAGNVNQFDVRANNELLGRSTTAPVHIRGQFADAADAVAIRLSANPDYTTAGAKLLSVGDNAGAAYAEKLAVDLGGALLLTNNDATLPAATNAYLQYNGTNLVGNVPTGKGFSLTANGVQQFSVKTVAGAAACAGQVDLAHLAGGSAAMGIGRCLIGLGAGTTSSGTAVTASGHDMAGRIGVTVNSTGTVSQPILLAQFAVAYASPPFMSLYPANAATASIALATAPFAVTTTSGFSVMANTTGIPAGTYAWYYSAVIQ